MKTHNSHFKQNNQCEINSATTIVTFVFHAKKN